MSIPNVAHTYGVINYIHPIVAVIIVRGLHESCAKIFLEYHGDFVVQMNSLSALLKSYLDIAGMKFIRPYTDHVDVNSIRVGVPVVVNQ